MSFNKADVEKVLSLINSNDLSALRAEQFDQFQYQGFDPLKLVSALVKVKTDKSISDKDFIDDVLQMVAIGMIKGSVNDHNIKKMSEEGQKDVLAINSKYGIKMGGGRGQSSSVITFPRVMATFPDIAVRMTEIIGGKRFSGGPLMSTQLPEYMQVQVFPAVIPRGLNNDVKKMLLIASLCYSIDQSVQISQLKEPDLKSLAATQNNFTLVGHNSPVPVDEVRKNVFRKLPLTHDYQAIVSVLEVYKEKIDPSFNILPKTDFVSGVVG